MKIFVFWNKRDPDSKKIYQFLEDGFWIQLIEEEHEVIKAFKDTNFNLSTTRVSSYNGKELSVLEAIDQSDLLVFFTHGDNDRILKVQAEEIEDVQRATFVDCNTSALLKNKAIIAICCSSAKELGPYCVRHNNVPYYIGFKEPIFYDETRRPNKALKELMFIAYSEGFDKGFEDALNNMYTADKFTKRLRLTLQHSIIEKILTSKDRSLSKYANGQQFYLKGIDSLVCVGDSTRIVFK